MVSILKIVIAPDSFKESLDASQVALFIEEGIREIFPSAEIVRAPLADGGEGLARTLVEATGGRILHKVVTGPLGEKTEGFFGILGDGKTAVIETAAASGLPLVPPDKRNPMLTTTFGTGELILAAIKEGYRKIVVGIGGSATNDGGAGMAQALGARLLDKKGCDIHPGAQGLLELDSIDVSGLKGLLHGIEVSVACDVDNPLYGPKGAAAVYGPQKGATPAMIPVLDGALRHYAEVIKDQLGRDVAHIPGAGAAGGLGAGLVGFCDAVLKRGTDLVLEILQLEATIASGVDLVITGEGEINWQTVYGKAPIGVARLAKKHNVPVLALVGAIGKDADVVYEHGIDAIMPIVTRPITLRQAMAEAPGLLRDAAARAMRLVRINLKAAE